MSATLEDHGQAVFYHDSLQSVKTWLPEFDEDMGNLRTKEKCKCTSLAAKPNQAWYSAKRHLLHHEGHLGQEALSKLIPNVMLDRI